ncbi:MAG TPA: hypothetical protein VNI52_07620 [Sphingobacteriaceae bacterium]|nr:hypothetical protein [Sphingobacteriaceae bacterium]
MKTCIENIDTLRSELLRLKMQQYQLEQAMHQDVDTIKEKFSSPLKFFGVGKEKALTGSDEEDWVTGALRIGLPWAINALVFKRSGFILKTLVTLFSQKAAGNVNKNTVVNLIDRVTGFVKGIKIKGKHNIPIQHSDYGIPPDSETY